MSAEQVAAEQALREVMTSPLGVTAQIVFWSGSLIFLVLMITRQKMSPVDSLLAMIGIKPVSERDWVVNILHVSIILIPMALFFIELQTG